MLDGPPTAKLVRGEDGRKRRGGQRVFPRERTPKGSHFGPDLCADLPRRPCGLLPAPPLPEGTHNEEEEARDRVVDRITIVRVCSQLHLAQRCGDEAGPRLPGPGGDGLPAPTNQKELLGGWVDLVDQGAGRLSRLVNEHLLPLSGGVPRDSCSGARQGGGGRRPNERGRATQGGRRGGGGGRGGKGGRCAGRAVKASEWASLKILQGRGIETDAVNVVPRSAVGGVALNVVDAHFAMAAHATVRETPRASLFRGRCCKAAAWSGREYGELAAGLRRGCGTGACRATMRGQG